MTMLDGATFEAASLPTPVIDRGGPWVGVAGGDLNVAQWDAGVEGGHDERRTEHVRMHVVEAGPFADQADPAVRGAGVEASAVAASQDRAFATLADRQVEGAAGSGDERDGRRLVPFADDPLGPVPAFEPEFFDVGSAGFADTQAVQSEQDSDRGVHRGDALCGVEKRGHLTATMPRCVVGWTVGRRTY